MRVSELRAWRPAPLVEAAARALAAHVVVDGIAADAAAAEADRDTAASGTPSTSGTRRGWASG